MHRVFQRLWRLWIPTLAMDFGLWGDMSVIRICHGMLGDHPNGRNRAFRVELRFGRPHRFWWWVGKPIWSSGGWWCFLPVQSTYHHITMSFSSRRSEVHQGPVSSWLWQLSMFEWFLGRWSASQSPRCTCPGDVCKAFGAGADFVMLGVEPLGGRGVAFAHVSGVAGARGRGGRRCTRQGWSGWYQLHAPSRSGGIPKASSTHPTHTTPPTPRTLKEGGGL